MHKIVYNACFGGFSLSTEAVNWMKEKYPDFFNHIICRHDPRLVECVETLGDKASGRYSRLKIKEIDSDCYRIDDYDGSETVTTPDDLDWTIIT